MSYSHKKNMHYHHKKYSSKSQPSNSVYPQLSPDNIQEIMLNPNLRVPDSPVMMQQGAHLMVEPNDPALQELFSLNMKERINSYIQANDLFYANYPPPRTIKMSSDVIGCGVMPTGDPVIIPDERVFGNIGEFGRTGIGKSTLLSSIIYQMVKKGWLVIVFQQKEEFNHWATFPELAGKVLPLKAKELKLEEFDQEGSTDLIARSYERIYAQRLLDDIKSKLKKHQSIDSMITITETIKALEQFIPGRGSVEAHYKESMIYALKSITNSFPGVFDYKKSDFLDNLSEFSGLVPIQIDAPVADSTYLAVTIIQKFYLERKNTFSSARPFKPIIYVIEDGTLLIDEKKLGGDSPLISMSFLARRYNIGFIFIGHDLSSPSQKLISNLESLFILGITGQDTRRIQQILGSSYEQALKANVLQRGECLALVPSVIPRPVFMRFPLFQPPGEITENERQRIIRPFLDRVKAVKYTEPAPIHLDQDANVSQDGSGTTMRLDPLEKKVLVFSGSTIARPLGKMYDQLGINRRKGKSVIDNLERQGLGKIHTLSTGKVGGKIHLLEITDLGWKILKADGIEKSRTKTNGGFLHELGAHYLDRQGKQQGYYVSFEEVLAGGIRIDVVWRDKSGNRIFYNIGISSAEQEARAIEKLFSSPAFPGHKFILVARDKNFVKQVKYILLQNGFNKNQLRQIEMKVLAEYING